MKISERGWALVTPSVFVLVKEEILLGGVIWPDFLNAFIRLTIVFKLLKIFNYLQRSTGTNRIVD